MIFGPCVPVPVVPVSFSTVPLPPILYITIYILISYKDYRRGLVLQISTGTTGTGTRDLLRSFTCRFASLLLLGILFFCKFFVSERDNSKKLCTFANEQRHETLRGGRRCDIVEIITSVCFVRNCPMNLPRSKRAKTERISCRRLCFKHGRDLSGFWGLW